ncbi:hypothetical protein FEM08_31200 [Flavobacterium gilvum]|nr:hypothetical protein FEM08_31200 [Flavobacterium gilvum]
MIISKKLNHHVLLSKKYSFREFPSPQSAGATNSKKRK